VVAPRQGILTEVKLNDGDLPVLHKKSQPPFYADLSTNYRGSSYFSGNLGSIIGRIEGKSRFLAEVSASYTFNTCLYRPIQKVSSLFYPYLSTNF
jgi:hypothetical protein